VAQIPYDQPTFFKSVANRDVTANFMGSFFIVIEFDPEAKLIRFIAYNEVTLESGTRFRLNPKAAVGEQNKSGVLKSHERGGPTQGGGPVPIGGSLNCEWIWTEPFSPIQNAPVQYSWPVPSDK
jgi:hypothetical protein